MISKKHPFFSLESKIFTKQFHGIQFSFYPFRKSQENIIIGHCIKDLNLDNQKVMLEKILNELSIWDKKELKEFNLFIKKKQIFRLYETILTKILIKFGVPIYWGGKNEKFDIPPAKIILSKDQWNKPSIKIVSKRELYIIHNVPFISISHTKKDVYIALSSRPIGTDNELINDHSNSWQYKSFSEHESKNFIKFLNKRSIFSKKFIYTIMWALKESTMKVDEIIPLGLLPKVAINIINNNIITENPQKSKIYQNYILLMKDSVLVLTF